MGPAWHSKAAPKLRIFIFLAIVLSIIAGVHAYFWVRLVRDTQLPPPYRVWATAAILVLAACLPLPLILGRRLDPSVARFFAWPSYIWMGLMFLLLVLLLVGDVVRLLTVASSAVAGQGPIDPARRTVVARILGALAGGTAGLFGALGVGQALRPLFVRELEIPIARLPAASDGTTIVQITDVHIGATIGRGFVEEMVRKVNALYPDLIAITGDLVDGSVDRLWDAVTPLGDLRAKKGIYFVTGNHEYFSGVDQWLQALPRLGIRVLANERVPIDGPDGAGFDLAGVHDHRGGRTGGPGADVDRALAGRDPERAVVLLAHQPRDVFDADRLDVDLQLSGHTHGGQIWPFRYFVGLDQPYVEGLHRHGRTQIYVSPGTGYWGPPMRLLTRAEITRVTLRRGQA